MIAQHRSLAALVLPMVGAAVVGGALLTSVANATPDSVVGERAGVATKRPNTAILRAMTDEIKRSAELSLPGASKPYYVAYLIHEIESVGLFAANGALVERQQQRYRLATAQVRLGDYRFDNSNFLGAGPLSHISPISVEDDYDAVRRSLWLLSDEAYKHAVEAFEAKKAAQKDWSKSTEEVADFSHEAALERVVDEPQPLRYEPYENLLRHVSQAFRAYPFLQSSRATATLVTSRRYFLSTEGTLLVEPRTVTEVALACSAQADDGMPVHNFAFHASVDGVAPADETVLLSEANRIARELDEIRTAPQVDDFDGPVLFEGEAAGQLLELALHDELSGTPPPKPSRNSGSEYARRLGQRVMPKGIRLVDDPGQNLQDGVSLLGSYLVDNEGVPGQKVTLVEDGTLKDLLMTRAPRVGSTRSNGHARQALPAMGGASPSNLILSGSGPIVARDLRQRLVEEIKKAKAAYGLIVRLMPERIDTPSHPGDPTTPCMCTAAPITRRVMPDGKEQVVRGPRFERMDTQVLERIVGVGRTPSVHNCSSMHPLKPSFAFVSPALLVAHVVVKKPEGPQPRPPLISRPR